MTFFSDFLKSPFLSLLFFGKYVKQFIVWVGNLLNLNFNAIGTMALVIVECLIFALLVRFIVFIAKTVKYIISVFRRNKDE